MEFRDKPGFYEIITGHSKVNACSSGCGGSYMPYHEKIHSCGGSCGIVKTRISSCGGWGGGSCGAPSACGGLRGRDGCGGIGPYIPSYTGGCGAILYPYTNC